MLTLSVPRGDEGSAMVVRLPRRVCGVGGVDREAAGVALAGRTLGELLQRRGRFWSVARRVSAYVGAAPSRVRGRSGPVPKPRAAASASGPPLGTRYVRSSAVLRLERACGRNPGDPVTDGTGR